MARARDVIGRPPTFPCVLGVYSINEDYPFHVRRVQSPPYRRLAFIREKTVPVIESKIHIIGIGSDGQSGLTARARELLNSAELILGSDNALDVVSGVKGERR